MKRFLYSLVVLFAANILFPINVANAQTYKFKYSADKGDGTYVNPICNGDFPDCDVIRVDDTFYFVSTTMYQFPGATLLKSKDLVNWEYCANPLLLIENNDAYNLLNGGFHYGQGMWASSLNYHNGKFYIYFISYGLNGYDSGRNVLLTATDPEGEWTMEYWPEHYYDAGWLFDDGENGDGFVYVACGIGDIWINKLNGKTLQKITSTRIVQGKDGYEGSHMYHIGDYYYVYVTTGGYWKGQTIYRSKNPMGPYEEVPYKLFQGDAIHQGALVDTPTGEWWTILFKDAGPIGRVPYLEPVTWKDGWPQIGKYDEKEKRWADVSRNGAKYKKPDVGAEYPKTYLPTNDAFASPTLGMQWQWNHNPQSQAWSLTDRPGWMRLYSCTVTDNLMRARGSLTQRIMGFYSNGSSSTTSNYGTIKLDVSNMHDGDIAGLAVVQNPYSFIGVKMVDGKKYLYSQRCSFNERKPTLVEEKTGAELTSDIIYLRANTNYTTNACSYYYSYQPTSGYVKWGVTMNMGYTLEHFVGQRYYIFNYSTVATGGYVDVDWFTTEVTIPVDDFAQLDAEEVIVPAEDGVEPYTGFPFTAEQFNPSIIGTGKFAIATKAVTTAPNGLAGWQYSEGWDISAFNYLVLNLVRKSTINSELRIYDSSNVWAEPYVISLKNQKTVSVDLHNMVTASGRKIEPANIRMIALSSDGSQAIYIKEVFLSDDGETPTGVSSVCTDKSQAEIYDLNGRKATPNSKGVLIKNNKKILVK